MRDVAIPRLLFILYECRICNKVVGLVQYWSICSIVVLKTFGVHYQMCPARGRVLAGRWRQSIHSGKNYGVLHIKLHRNSSEPYFSIYFLDDYLDKERTAVTLESRFLWFHVLVRVFIRFPRLAAVSTYIQP